jgi:hypothetical protein
MNIASLGTPSVVSHIGTHGGVLVNITDGDEATYDEYYDGGMGGGGASATWKLLFPSDMPISTLHLVFLGNTGSGSNGGNNITVKYFQGSTLTQLINTAFTPNAVQNIDLTINHDVSYITVYLQQRSSSAGTSYGSVLLYELYAYKHILDSDVRVENQSGKSILAKEGILKSALRSGGSAGAFGYSLVDITDPAASPIRVMTASGVKAISKYY